MARGDVTSLPVWAQQHIAHIQRRLDEATTRIEHLSGKHAGSNVQISSHYTYPDLTLPPDSQIDFYLGKDRQKYRDMISVRHMRSREGVLYVQGGGGYLSVRPVVSNVVEITLEGL